MKEEKIETEKTEIENNKNNVQKPVKERKKKIDKEKDELIKANLDLKEKVLRITAEMQNMKRRYELDMANLYKYEGFNIIEKILPVIDNFERAMNIKNPENEKFLEGFKMIYENLIAILKEKGITEIEALNKSFDPNIMNAMMTEVNEEVDSNTVIKVLQKGYMYHDKLLRPAMVCVSEKESE